MQAHRLRWAKFISTLLSWISPLKLRKLWIKFGLDFSEHSDFSNKVSEENKHFLVLRFRYVLAELYGCARRRELSLIANKNWFFIHPRNLNLGSHLSVRLSICLSHNRNVVKIGYRLTSITWPHRGLRCWLIEVSHNFKETRNANIITWLGHWAGISHKRKML